MSQKKKKGTKLRGKEIQSVKFRQTKDPVKNIIKKRKIIILLLYHFVLLLLIN